MTRAPDSETRAPALVWRRDWGEVRARSAPPGTRRGPPAPDAQTSRDEKGESPGNRNASGFSGATPVSDRTVKQIVSTPEPGFHRFKAVYKHAINYSRGGAPVPPAGLAGTISGGISRMASLDERLMRPTGGARVCIRARPRAARHPRQVAAHQDHRRDADRSARCDRECGARKASDQRLEREMSSDPYARLHDG